MSRSVYSLFVLLLLTASLSAFSQNPQPCTSSEHRQLDFWIGDWDVVDIDAPQTVVARAQVTGILGGCAIHEDYQQIDGFKGQSFSTFDRARGVWHQTWVTNRGSLLVVEGRMENGMLLLTGTDNIKKALFRVWWKPEGGAVRERAEISSDHGKTWKMLFDMQFKPHQP